MGRISWHGATVSHKPKSKLAQYVGQKLLVLRQDHQVSMKNVAHQCKMSVAFLCDVENGKMEPGSGTLLKLARFFNISVGYFLDEFKGKI